MNNSRPSGIDTPEVVEAFERLRRLIEECCYPSAKDDVLEAADMAHVLIKTAALSQVLDAKDTQLAALNAHVDATRKQNELLQRAVELVGTAVDSESQLVLTGAQRDELLAVATNHLKAEQSQQIVIDTYKQLFDFMKGNFEYAAGEASRLCKVIEGLHDQIKNLS